MSKKDALIIFTDMFEILEDMAGPGYDPDGWTPIQKRASDIVYKMSFGDFGGVE